MVAQMEEEGFGACSNTGACEAACPKEIKLENIAWLNRELLRTTLRS
jgi:succinate dehydrogenase / fumarate reductase iron-sulfur subunit